MNRLLSLCFFAVTLCAMAYSEALPKTAERIASVDANATEILLNLGLESQLVAVDMTSQSLLGNPNIEDLGYHRALSAAGRTPADSQSASATAAAARRGTDPAVACAPARRRSRCRPAGPAL